MCAVVIRKVLSWHSNSQCGIITICQQQQESWQGAGNRFITDTDRGLIWGVRTRAQNFFSLRLLLFSLSIICLLCFFFFLLSTLIFDKSAIISLSPLHSLQKQFETNSYIYNLPSYGNCAILLPLSIRRLTRRHCPASSSLTSSCFHPSAPTRWCLSPAGGN